MDNQTEGEKLFKELAIGIEAEGLDLDDLEEISNNHKGFPYIVMMFAVSKDTTDTITAGLGSFFTTPLASLVLLFWMFGKTSFIKKRMRKWFVKRVLIWFMAKFFPLVNMAPLTSALVVMTHYRETKIIQVIDMIIETAYEQKHLGFNEIIEIIQKEEKMIFAT